MGSLHLSPGLDLADKPVSGPCPELSDGCSRPAGLQFEALDIAGGTLAAASGEETTPSTFSPAVPPDLSLDLGRACHSCMHDQHFTTREELLHVDAQ